MSSSQPRRSPRLAAQQQQPAQKHPQVYICVGPGPHNVQIDSKPKSVEQPSKEFFRARRSPRLEAMRVAEQNATTAYYKKANSHYFYITVKSLPGVRECANEIHGLINDISNTTDTVEKIRKVYNIYNYILTTHTVHNILAACPSFRYISLARITEFCYQLPYNTTLPIQRNRLMCLYSDLMRHQYYVPEPA